MTVQVPAANKVKVEPLTVQIVDGVDVKLTPKVELLVAVSGNGVPTVPVVAGLKLMVCAVSAGVASPPPPHAASKAEVARATLAKLIRIFFGCISVSLGLNFESAV